MNKLKQFRIIFILLFVSAWMIYFFLPKPPLLEGLSYSKAFFDDERHLLRLTLSHDDKYRLFTPLSSLPNSLKDATLLQEDQYFYFHPGINPFAMLKAAWQTYVLHSRRLGASTITMQVARMRYGLNSKHLKGKMTQIFKAIQLERHYSKDDILQAYFNLAPYGNNIEGAQAASLIFFNKTTKELQLPEALTLSVIPQNPGKRRFGNQQLKEIRNKLFQRWLNKHPEDKKQAANMDLPLVMQTIKNLPFKAPHFVNSLLPHQSQGQGAVVTTLNSRLQKIVERITQHYLAKTKALGVDNAAVMLVDSRTLAVKALLGSGDFFNPAIGGQINGTDVKRSPGSTLKPFIYALALDQGLIHPATVLKDVPHRFGGYNPENFDYEFLGPITAQEALILSRNIPAIDLANQLSHPSLHELLVKAQVSQLKPASWYGLALSLGGAELSMKELTSLYVMLDNDGVWRKLRFTEDEARDDGLRLLSPEASFLVLDMLAHTPRNPSLSSFDLPVSWKTGTSSGFRDAWAVGTFGPYVLTVWLGHFNNKSNPALIGKEIAAPLFFELIEAIQQEFSPLPRIQKYPENRNLKQIEVCKASGMLPTRYCQDRTLTWFIPGKSPIKTDTIYREVAIDSRTGLRTCHINEYTYFEVYEFWTSDLLKIFKQAGIQRRTPPVFEQGCDLSAQQGISPQITSPQSELSYIIPAHISEPSRIPFTAVTDGDVKTLYWFVNDSFVAKTKRDQTYWWSAKPGHYVVRVVDNHGLSNALDLVVSGAN